MATVLGMPFSGITDDGLVAKVIAVHPKESALKAQVIDCPLVCPGFILFPGVRSDTYIIETDFTSFQFRPERVPAEPTGFFPGCSGVYGLFP